MVGFVGCATAQGPGVSDNEFQSGALDNPTNPTNDLKPLTTK